MRLHGDRVPKTIGQGEAWSDTASGAPNEVWSYGEEIYEICKKYIAIREKLRHYTRDLMKQAHVHGRPVIRPLFYEFPRDPKAWEVETQYMYGGTFLVAPVLEAGQRKLKVYLPAGAKWKSFDGKVSYEGGIEVEIDCPIDDMPVFVRQ
jgi:alpha-D-xyloside xylohydrolase